MTWRRGPVMRAGLAAVLAVAGASGCGVEGDGGAGEVPSADAVTLERSVFLMGTIARFAVEARDRAAALESLERMVRTVEDVEAALSTWRPDSDLSRLNRADVGVDVPLSDVACAALLRAERRWRETGGAFDPTVGSLLQARRVVGEGGRRPHPAELAAATRRTGFGGLRIDEHDCTASRIAEVLLDAGAFGKGAALDEVRRTMRSAAAPGAAAVGAAESPRAWIIDFGGQVAVGGTSLTVAIAHPARRGEVAVELRLEDGSIATSGGSERDAVLEDGSVIGHIVDPRTGTTVVRRGSVTVWSSSALDADALSTALQVMGADDGMAWAEERGVAACFLGFDGASDLSGAARASATAAFSKRFDGACAR